MCLLYSPTHTNPNKSHFGEGLGAFSTTGNRHLLSCRNNRWCPGGLISPATQRTPRDGVPLTLPWTSLTPKFALPAFSRRRLLSPSRRHGTAATKNKPAHRSYLVCGLHDCTSNLRVQTVILVYFSSCSLQNAKSFDNWDLESIRKISQICNFR